jgi:hypothetical protein
MPAARPRSALLSLHVRAEEQMATMRFQATADMSDCSLQSLATSYRQPAANKDAVNRERPSVALMQIANARSRGTGLTTPHKAARQTTRHKSSTLCKGGAIAGHRVCSMARTQTMHMVCKACQRPPRSAGLPCTAREARLVARRTRPTSLQAAICQGKHEEHASQ